MKNDLSKPKGQILAHLKSGRIITPRTAVALYDHWRLSSVINRLRDEFGYDAIKTTLKTTIHGKRFGEYKWMLSE